MHGPCTLKPVGEDRTSGAHPNVKPVFPAGSSSGARSNMGQHAVAREPVRRERGGGGREEKVAGMGQARGGARKAAQDEGYQYCCSRAPLVIRCTLLAHEQEGLCTYATVLTIVPTSVMFTKARLSAYLGVKLEGAVGHASAFRPLCSVPVTPVFPCVADFRGYGPGGASGTIGQAGMGFIGHGRGATKKSGTAGK